MNSSHFCAVTTDSEKHISACLCGLICLCDVWGFAGSRILSRCGWRYFWELQNITHALKALAFPLYFFFLVEWSCCGWCRHESSEPRFWSASGKNVIFSLLLALVLCSHIVRGGGGEWRGLLSVWWKLTDEIWVWIYLDLDRSISGSIWIWIDPYLDLHIWIYLDLWICPDNGYWSVWIWIYPDLVIVCSTTLGCQLKVMRANQWNTVRRNGGFGPWSERRGEGLPLAMQYLSWCTCGNINISRWAVVKWRMMIWLSPNMGLISHDRSWTTRMSLTTAGVMNMAFWNHQVLWRYFAVVRDNLLRLQPLHIGGIRSWAFSAICVEPIADSGHVSPTPSPPLG